MELAGCKPFYTVCLSFLPLHELRYEHLQTVVCVPSAEAMLLAMPCDISKDAAQLSVQQCLPCVLCLERAFWSRASSFVQHWSACLNAHLLRARKADLLWFLVAWRSAQLGLSHVLLERISGQKMDWVRTQGCSWLVSPSQVMQSCSHRDYWPQGSCQCGLETQGFSSAQGFIFNIKMLPTFLREAERRLQVNHISPRSLAQESTGLWGVRMLRSGRR